MESTKRGKYAGECPKCNLVLMDNETTCVRCGAEFPLTTPKTYTVIPQCTSCDCDRDSICKCKN